MKLRLSLALLSSFLIPTFDTDATEVFKNNATGTLNLGTCWDGGNAPGPGDVAVWDALASNTTNQQLGANLQWAGLKVISPGLDYAVRPSSGLSLTLGSAGVDMSTASKNFTFNSTLNLGANQTWAIAAGRTFAAGALSGSSGFTLTKTGDGILSLTGTTADFAGGLEISGGSIQSANASGTQVLSGFLAGTGQLNKTGAGALTLVTDNSGFTGAIGLAAGTLNLMHPSALGSGSLTITGGSLDNTSGGPLNLSGSCLQNWNGDFAVLGTHSLDLGGTVVTLGGSPTVTVAANTLTLGGPLTGTGSLTKAGAGTLALVPGAALDLGGQFAVNGGELTLAGGDLTTSGVTFGGTSGTLNLQAGTLTSGPLSRTAGTATLAFKGGTLKARTGSGTYLSGLTAATVGAARARIDTNGYSITVAQPLLHDPALGATADGGLVLTGFGTLTLTGASTFSGSTLVTEGRLVLGTGGSVAASPVIELAAEGTLEGSAAGTTLASGQTVTGSGQLDGKITIGPGATLAPGSSAAVGTLGGNADLVLAGNATFRVSKLGTLEYDSVAAASVRYGGTLTVTASGLPLAAGDSFKLFDAVSYTGSFSAFDLPTLSFGNFWDPTGLLTDGTLSVVNLVSVPIFTPPAGNYFGTPSVTLTSVVGSTIHYTTDGSDPAISGTVISAPSPVTGVIVPTDATGFTLRAYASVPGFSSGAATAAVYNTLSAAVWTLNGSGPWSEPGNWRFDLVPSGTGLGANFNTLTLGADATVTLDGPRTLGRLKFGDVGNAFDWTLAGSTLTLDGGGPLPTITVDNQTATLSALAAPGGLVKDGAGMLSLVGGSMTYGGPTTLNAGVLELKNNGNGSGNGFRSPITTSSGTAVWLTSDSGWNDLRANIAGPGSVVKKGAGTVRVGTWSGVPTLNYSGPTTVETGTLNLQGQAAGRGFDTTGPLIVNAGATFDFGGLAAQSAANAARFGALIGTGSIAGAYGSAYLECGNGGGSGTFDGLISNAGGSTSLIKSGTGTQTLTAANTYNGTTTVTGGTLRVTNPTGSGTGTSAVTVNATGTVGGTGTITGTVAVQANGVIAPGIAGPGTLTTGALTLAGTYQCQVDGASADRLAVTGDLTLTGATLTVASLNPTVGTYVIATHTGNRTGTFASVPAGYAVDYATPNQLKLIVPVTAGYASWIAGYGLTGASALANADPDKDGVANAVEFVVGGNPATGMDAALLPTIALVTNPGNGVPAGSYLKFTYRRTPASAYLNPGVAYDADLTGTWTSATGAVQVVTTGFFTTPTPADKVDVYVPRPGNEANGKLFGRLRVMVP